MATSPGRAVRSTGSSPTQASTSARAELAPGPVGAHYQRLPRAQGKPTTRLATWNGADGAAVAAESRWVERIANRGALKWMGVLSRKGVA